MNKNIWNNEELVTTLKGDKVVVIPTDTIYGMVGRALSEKVVNHIYDIRNRAPEKPCIILIGNISELGKFSVDLSTKQKAALLEYWPIESAEDGERGISIVLDCIDEKFTYLHRGTNTLAFRLPRKSALRDLLLQTGPLIAPSANIEKFPASESIEDAKKYFGDKVDLYVDAGPITSKPSQIVRLHPDGSVTILRE